MLTGSNSRSDVARAREAGAAAYVTKDRIAAQLIDAIRELARLSRWYPVRAVVQLFAVIQVLLSAALVGLILMHSGRDAGLGGMGFTPGLAGRHAHRRAEPDAADDLRRDPLRREHVLLFHLLK